MGQFEDEFDTMMNRTPEPDYASEFDELSRPSGPKQYTRYSGPNAEDPVRDQPTQRPSTIPKRLKRAPSLDAATIGFKEKNEDRLRAARELYPDSDVYGDQEGTVTVGRPDGTIYNFERPDFGHAVAGAVRGVFNWRNAGTPWGAEEDDVRSGTSGDMIRQNADSALPNIATRGAANAAMSALPGGAIVQAARFGLANAAVPYINRAINSETAGGDSQTESEVNTDAAIDGAIGAGSVLLPAAITRGVKHFLPNSVLNRGLDELGHTAGVKNPELARMLGLTKEPLPAEVLATDRSALQVQQNLRNPKAARVNGAAKENIDALEQSAIGQRQDAARGIEDAVANNEAANKKVLEQVIQAREQVRNAKNTSRVAVNEADKAAAEMKARDSEIRAAQDAEYNAARAAQGEEYAAQTRVHAEQIAKMREADAQAKLRYNQNRAREANQRAMNNNEIDDQIQAAKENYAGRYAQNRVSELEAQRPGAVSKVLPPQPSTVPPKPTKPAPVEKPTRPAKGVRPIAEPYQQPATPDLDAARVEAKTAAEGVTSAKANAAELERQLEPFDKMQKNIRAAVKKVAGANNDGAFTIGKNVVRMGAAYATGGKTLAAEGAWRAGRRLFSHKATLKIMQDPTLMRRAQELAAEGKRLNVDEGLKKVGPEVEGFVRRLEAFMAETESD